MSECQSEHPDAPQIRRQVEYYFSDENLPTDLHLLRCCGGRDNLPVSINRICGFKRMRGFKPRKVVVEALRKSAFLEVTADGKQVKRKVPLVGKCLLDEDHHDTAAGDDEIAYDPRTRREISFPVPLVPQTQTTSPNMAKGMTKPTGFEESFCEGPITPQQAQEEEAMYDSEKPFAERIEIGIQRFKSRRRMHQMYAQVFDKFMIFGGIEGAPRMFGGLSKQDMVQMSAEEIARAQATLHVPWDREDKSKWVVDFVGVAEAFLSSWFPAYFGYNSERIENASKVLRSFHNYLLLHDVCPEHNTQLLLARNLCDKAETELPQVKRARLALPGPFNVAASTIVGGSHAGSYAGTSAWIAELEEDEVKNTHGIGMRLEEAMVTFKTGIAAHGTDEQYKALMEVGPDMSSMKQHKSESLGLDVVSICPAAEETQGAYAAQNIHYKHKLTLQPLGSLKCRTFNLPTDKEYDLIPGTAPPGSSFAEDRELEFWVEDSVLKECYVGMKIDATVITCQGGIVILDEVNEVMCSFFRSISNEIWAERRLPKFKILNKGLEDAIEKDELDKDGQVGGEELGAGELSDDLEE